MNDFDQKKKSKRPDKKLYMPPGHLNKKIDNLNSVHDDGKLIETNIEKTTSNQKKVYKKQNELLEKEELNEIINKTLENKFNLLDLDKSKAAYQTDEKFNQNKTDKSYINLNEKFLEQPKQINIEKSGNYLKNRSYYDQVKPNHEKTNEDFSHVLEIYNISNETKTQDLVTALSNLNSKEFQIRWVNDNNAIVVFSSKENAQEALKISYPNLKLRKLAHATLASKLKAKEFGSLPYKQRPETSACLARRLVSGALGIKLKLSPEQREAERKKLQDAKERKKNQEKLQRDAWEGK